MVGKQAQHDLELIIGDLYSYKDLISNNLILARFMPSRSMFFSEKDNSYYFFKHRNLKKLKLKFEYTHKKYLADDITNCCDRIKYVIN
jgi:hypothetical protein